MNVYTVTIVYTFDLGGFVRETVDVLAPSEGSAIDQAKDMILFAHGCADGRISVCSCRMVEEYGNG